MDKDFFGIIAVILTLAAFLPYIKGVVSGKTRPHVFSWIIWGAATIIVFAAQWSDRGGAGTWAIGLSGILSLLVAVLAYQGRAHIRITKSDWVYFITAILAIPIWVMTSNALWAVIILTSIDLLGFLPTLRKSWENPYQEQVLMPCLIILRNITSIIALENYSLITLTFPVSVSVVACVLITVLLVGRRIHSKQL